VYLDAMLCAAADVQRHLSNVATVVPLVQCLLDAVAHHEPNHSQLQPNTRVLKATKKLSTSSSIPN